MWLSGKVRQRAGALSASAERFVAERWGHEPERYRGGRDGLVALCRQLERFAHAHEVDEESERRFVEGAGALLGVLLIEHVPDAEHSFQNGQHRVRLGAHGFFDPFSAVDRALDAPDIRRALANEIGRAEAEAGARGPISRLVTALLRLLAKERPDLTLAEQFDCSLKLRQRDSDELLELDLRRAVETTHDQRETAVEEVARRLVSLLPGAPPADMGSIEEIQQRLVPRLTRADSLRELTTQGKSVLFARPLVAELALALLLEYQGRARYVRSDELRHWRLDDDEAHALALANLRERSARARLVREQLAEGALFVARTGDGRDSARVLLPELLTELVTRVGSRVAVALPHRDTFFACASDNPALLARMAQRAAHDAARAPHALSSQPFTLSSDGLRALVL